MHTIFALASARGKSGVAVIRISGRDAHAAVKRLCGDVPAPRKAVLRTLRGTAGDVLDSGLVITFSENASYTGEEAAELQVHGSTATVSAVLNALADQQGLRPALPGEFTRRALENGRMDLTEVEGLADLIDAETEAQRRQALRVASGAAAERVAAWRDGLVQAMALLAVTIDFADEEVPEDMTAGVMSALQPVRDGLRRELAGADAAERVRSGFEVAIVGPPNIGKSTLLNALAGRDAAITSDVAGTTRDVIEVRMDISGLPVTVLDTAGIRETDDLVEALGVARARERALAADLRIYLREDARPLDPVPGYEDIVLAAKGDLSTSDGPSVSGLTGAGIPELLKRIGDVLADRVADAGIVTQVRHREAATRALGHVDAALAGLGQGDPEIVAEELRSAAHALDAWVGRIDIEDVLDRVFASFCLGK